MRHSILPALISIIAFTGCPTDPAPLDPDPTPPDAGSDITEDDATACGDGESLCEGECVDTDEDLAHCGACDAPCETECVEGQCLPPTDTCRGAGDDCGEETAATDALLCAEHLGSQICRTRCDPDGLTESCDPGTRCALLDEVEVNGGQADCEDACLALQRCALLELNCDQGPEVCYQRCLIGCESFPQPTVDCVSYASCPEMLACLDLPTNLRQGACVGPDCDNALNTAACADAGPEGGTCVSGPNNTRVCTPAGTGPEGASCRAEIDCASGLLCVAGRCTPPCLLESGDCDTNDCLDLLGQPDQGVCGTACGGFEDDTCGEGQGCFPLEADAGLCAPTGEGVEGTTCQTNADCAAATICHDDPDGQSRCARLCDTTTNDPDALCGEDSVCAQDAAEGPDIGLCRPRRASCQDILERDPEAPSGRHWIQPDPDSPPFEVHCEMSIAGGGWTLVYKYIGTGRFSQRQILASVFGGPRAVAADLITEAHDGINRAAYEAFWNTPGRAWMSRWRKFGPDGAHEEDNHATFTLGDQVSWGHVHDVPQTACVELPGPVTLSVFDKTTTAPVDVGTTTFRFSAFNDGRGFLAVDDTQVAYFDTCGQTPDNHLTWPGNLTFDAEGNVPWPQVIRHMWYRRGVTTKDKDRCAWTCWADIDDNTAPEGFSGREWYVR